MGTTFDPRNLPNYFSGRDFDNRLDELQSEFDELTSRLEDAEVGSEEYEQIAEEFDDWKSDNLEELEFLKRNSRDVSTRCDYTHEDELTVDWVKEWVYEIYDRKTLECLEAYIDWDSLRDEILAERTYAIVDGVTYYEV